jgi:glycosyltransferase involved in cell wall biosynthesis
MRVVFSNYDDRRNPYYGGGGARAIHEVARRLASRHAVTVVTGNYPGAADEWQEGVCYGGGVGGGGGPRAGQLAFQFRLPLEVRRRAFDVWIESLTPPFSTACLPWFTRRPVVALTQVLAGRGMAAKYGLPFAAVERLGLRSYRHAIALSRSIERQLRAANPRLETVVIPNGVTPEAIAAAVEREERHCLFLGRIDREQKGLDLLFEAWAARPAAAGRLLVLAGSGPPGEEAWLRARLTRAHGVQWVGRVEGPAKQALWRGASVLAMPSRFEASPLVLLEAFCAGVPAVLFDLPEFEEMPATCCVKVPCFDAAALGVALDGLLADGDRRREMGRAAKAFVGRFDWDLLALQYERFIQVLPAAGRPG